MCGARPSPRLPSLSTKLPHFRRLSCRSRTNDSKEEDSGAGTSYNRPSLRRKLCGFGTGAAESCPHVPQPGVGKTVVGPDKKPRPEPTEKAPALPGHFVSPEHRTDLQRFLDEVKSLVERRRSGRDEPRG